VVDYLGLAHELKTALATYTESGGKGQTTINQDEVVAVMEEKYEICCDDWSLWKTGRPEERLALLPAAQELQIEPHMKPSSPSHPSPNNAASWRT